jgi:hypothetical protein
MEPEIAFRLREQEEPACEVRVNFGVFAGRQVTPAEIDDLARELRETVPAFAIVAEERHEFGGSVEAALHQVVIEVERAFAGDDPDRLGAQLVAAGERWAEACIAARHLDLADL